MTQETKAVVLKSETFDLLEIRLGKVIDACLEPSAPKKAYKIKIDFGKFGIKTSVGRFTNHAVDDLIGSQVLGVLNFTSVTIGTQISEVLILGVQYPKAESGEATIVIPEVQAKIGGKLF